MNQYLSNVLLKLYRVQPQSRTANIPVLAKLAPILM